MQILFHNSLTKKKELFKPYQTGIVNIYICGVTVYDLCHLGHARGAVNFDLLRRFLLALGYKVNFVKNYTDIDDKIITQANRLKISTTELTEKMIKEHDQDMASLFVLAPDKAPKATDNISGMVTMIKNLIAQGFAYENNGDVFFEVIKFTEYGKLSGKNIDELQAGARIAINENKKNALDFVLWKTAKEGEPAWDSPWGKGRPGWHIECSCMCQQFIKGGLDIHAGGSDLIFPHHENEIAQSESLTKKKLAAYWLHNGMIKIQGQKMSKSLANFATIRDLLNQFDPEIVRFFILQSHYRQSINFSLDGLNQAHLVLNKIYFSLVSFYEEYKIDFAKLKNTTQDINISNFLEALADDLNSSVAIAKLLEWCSQLNQQIKNYEMAELAAQKILKAINILGICQQEPQEWFHQARAGSKTIEKEKVINLIENRKTARQQKDWQKADKIKAELNQLGIDLKDKKENTYWYYNSNLNGTP